MPIRITQLRYDYSAIGSVDEFPVSNVDTHVTDPGFIRILEEYKVAGFGACYEMGFAIVTFCIRTCNRLSCLVKDVVDKPAAVESGW